MCDYVEVKITNVNIETIVSLNIISTVQHTFHSLMAKTHKKKAATRARAGRWANQTAYPPEQTFNDNGPEVFGCSPELKVTNQ
jgi:hypothetical protein